MIGNPYYSGNNQTEEPIVPVPGSLKLSHEVISMLADGKDIKDWTKVTCLACKKLYAVPPGEKYVEVCEDQYCQRSRTDTLEFIEKKQKEHEELMKKLIGS